jgi:hypothetical protein
MGVNVYPSVTTSSLVKKKITGSFTTPSNIKDYPYGSSHGTATGGAAIKYANNTWVMIQPGGRILTSTDRLTWNYVHNNLLAEMAKYVDAYVPTYRPTHACKSLEYGDGKWMAYFSNSLLLTSTDLVTWTVVLDLSSPTSNTGQGTGLNKVGATGCVVWNGTANLWMLVNAGKFVFTSANGTTWTEQTTGWTTVAGATAVPNRVAWANQLFIIIDSLGQIVTSADGITFTLRTAVFGGSAANDIASNGPGSNASATTIIVAAAGKWAYSTNGTTWTINTANGTRVHTNCIWDGSRFVINTTTAAEAYYSANGQGGLALTATPTGLTAGVALSQQLTSDGTGKVAVATVTGFITSADVTVSWNAFSTITSLGSNQNISSAVNLDTKRHSIVDGNGKIWFTQGKYGRVFVSTDNTGTNWVFHNSVLTNITNTTTDSNVNVVGLWYLNNRIFAALASGGLRVSSDNGTTWSSIITGFTNNIVDMAYGNGMYMAITGTAVGASSTTAVFRSTDAASWIGIASGSTGGATSRLFYNGGTVAYDTFTPRSITFAEGATYGWFEIIADANSTAEAVVSRSVNGVYWIDGLAGVGTNDYITYQGDVPAIMTPSSTTQVSITQGATYVPGSATYLKGGFQAKESEGKTVLFIRANNTGLGYLIYRNNGSHVGTRNYYTTCKVNGPAIGLNPDSPTQTAISSAPANFDPVYLNHHPNIGWIAVYYVVTASPATYSYIVVSSTDGVTWDFVGSVPGLNGTGNEYPFVFTNETDKLFIVTSTIASNASISPENVYIFSTSSVAANN